MSLASMFKAKWRLEVLDDPTQYVEGQFIPTEFTEGVGANYTTISGFGSENPVLQWVNGQLDTIQFTARMFSRNVAESITRDLEILKSFVRKDPTRRSPPPLLFTWGRQISKQVVINSLGGIRYDDIRVDGAIRGVALSIQLTEYRAYKNVVEELTNGESFVHIAKQGDTYESIAAFHYSRPEWGDLIRRRNPKYITLSPGDPIEIPEEWVLRTEVVTPESIPFRRKTSQLDVREAMFDARNITYVSHVL